MTRTVWAIVILAAMVAGLIVAILGNGWGLSALGVAVVGTMADGTIGILAGVCVMVSRYEAEPPVGP